MSSLGDVIFDLATNYNLLVTRTAQGTLTSGVYTPGATSTFTIIACVEPAYNQSRVIGGADLGSKVDGMHANDVRVIYTTTLLQVVAPATAAGGATQPDVITGLENAAWTVARVERWQLNQDTHFRVILTKQTGGAS